MNVANLQLEGLYLAMASIIDLLASKGVVTRQEIDGALERASAALASDERAAGLSPASRDAMALPCRFLRQANDMATSGEYLSFSELIRLVGQDRQQLVNDNNPVARDQ